MRPWRRLVLLRYANMAILLPNLKDIEHFLHRRNLDRCQALDVCANIDAFFYFDFSFRNWFDQMIKLSKCRLHHQVYQLFFVYLQHLYPHLKVWRVAWAIDVREYIVGHSRYDSFLILAQYIRTVHSKRLAAASLPVGQYGWIISTNRLANYVTGRCFIHLCLRRILLQDLIEQKCGSLINILYFDFLFIKLIKPRDFSWLGHQLNYSLFFSVVGPEPTDDLDATFLVNGFAHFLQVDALLGNMLRLWPLPWDVIFRAWSRENRRRSVHFKRALKLLLMSASAGTDSGWRRLPREYSRARARVG